VGAAIAFSAEKNASLTDAISQSSPDTERPAEMATLKQQNDLIAGITEEANHLAASIRIALRDAAAA